FALPNAEIMIHQPSGGARGQATDIEIAAKNILRTKQRLNEILAQNTGKPIDVVAQDTDRDHFMTAEEALEYGLIDQIVKKREETGDDKKSKEKKEDKKD
ncbi:MAG: ATP-dependent Clp protease proteolytic subunit, partial [Lachnospiraceae bacterium]|nr:ATP-dependent Clp protease proteolytic subunit [Lachnospiraceae bacterium]